MCATEPAAANGPTEWSFGKDRFPRNTNLVTVFSTDRISIAVNATLIAADRMSHSESYRRRREEWEIQRDAAESELKQLDAQLRALDIRHEAAELTHGLLPPRLPSECSDT